MLCETRRRLLIMNLCCILTTASVAFAGDPSDQRECVLKWLNSVKKMDSCSYSLKKVYDPGTADIRFNAIDQTEWVRASDGRFAATTDRWTKVLAASATTQPVKFKTIKLINRPGLGDLQLLETDQMDTMKATFPYYLTVTSLPSEQAAVLRHGGDGELDGYWLDAKSVPEHILSHLPQVVVRHDVSTGSASTVLEDKNEFGHCSIRLDPSHGCNPSYYEIKSVAGDLSAGGVHATRIPYQILGADGTTEQVIGEKTVGRDFEYSMVDGIWVTAKCLIENREEFAPPVQAIVSRWIFERTNIDFHQPVPT